MPCLEISMPEVDFNLKKLLAGNLTDAFVRATGFDSEIFGIRFFEYKDAEAASGGNLCTGKDGRPYIHFLLYSPRLRRSTRRKIVEYLTATFVESLNKPDWKPVIHICEHPYDNIGVEGALLSDSYKELADKKFYYDISDSETDAD